jgi:hypothetical protein
MSHENSSPEPRRGHSRKGPQPLASKTGAVRDAFAARGFANPQIVLRWREFAGPVLGRLTAPLSLSPQGQLTISADPSVALFLQHQTQSIVQRVNLALGGAPVSKVKVVSGKFARAPAPKTRGPLTQAQRKWADQTAEKAKDPALKVALLRLAEAIAAEAGPKPAPLRPKS